MAFVQLSDPLGSMEVLVFPKVLTRYARFIAEGKKAHLVRFDEEDYNNYLAAQNLSDCEKNRDAWALYYWKKAKA